MAKICDRARSGSQHNDDSNPKGSIMANHPVGDPLRHPLRSHYSLMTLLSPRVTRCQRRRDWANSHAAAASHSCIHVQRHVVTGKSIDGTSIFFIKNLFNSRKLFTGLYQAKCLAHGVVRSSGRGFCEEVIQREGKNQKRAKALRGMTMAARLVSCPGCPDLLSVSIYDTKPVNIISTLEDDIHWVEKKRKVWSEVHKDIKIIGFPWLNAIDDYNNGMNLVDMSDQLRNNYCPNHWLCNRKWW